ncbi:uncharacterized protein [Leuresthes tenuis]|uniref:uncharacterized protein n=1 Tax=Leuresthes tenuis TaxID=355514 RepID=UPI003B5043BC
MTPNTSLGFVQATPSRVLPSPTVNTREALGVIMDMFQAPTLLEDTFSSTSQLHAAERDFAVERSGGVFSLTKPATAAPFTIFQDNDDKENLSAAPSAPESLKPVRALSELAVQKAEKPNDTPPDLIPDESTMWGARFNSLNSLAACPNSTTDFAMLAQFVSTPFTHKTPFNGNFFQDPEINCDGGDADNIDFIRHQTKKLSPIMEQSPSDDKGSETAGSQLGLSSARQGTIVGEGLATAQHSLTTFSNTLVQPPPPAVLSFRDQTFCPTSSSTSAGPSWEVYTSPEQPPKPASLSPAGPKSEPFKILEDLDKPASAELPENEFCDVPMSPECALKPDWLTVRSPEATAEPDLDAFLSPRCLRRSEATFSNTLVQPPPSAVLSFRDQTFCPTSSSTSAGPSWEVYSSPEQPPKPASLSPVGPSWEQPPKPASLSPVRSSWEVYTSPEQPPKPASLSPAGPKSEPFKILEDLDKPASAELPENEFCDVPMSPECALKPDWLTVRSPEATAEPDLDAFLSPRRLRRSEATFSHPLDVPMTPEQPRLCADVPVDEPMMDEPMMDEPMMSPDRGLKGADVSMSAETARLVSDPWDNELISDLLSTISPPLSSHPRCISWQRSVPTITPKVTITMGKASLRIDCVLGEGAFATVYQATDPVTSEKKVLKVQKPANPWEFYINTQLDARLQPGVRHLYSSVHAAHLFDNGSVLLGELHNYGTLLNVVNFYKTLSDKVMPQPLVLYFTTCILHMVEQLHAARIIHADIKPDNFMLGERFLDNKCFDSESVDHGLVLIDLGQSIDMDLFPEGTAFTAKCLTSGFQCTEMLSGKPWSYQTDYFGIAGTVYCMLFGTYMQVTNEGGVWKTNGVFRRNPHSDLWLEFFHTLLNVPDCGSPPSLRSLRCKLAAVLQHNYSSKLPSLKSRLVVLLLENRKAGRR